ncbi:MAG: CDP-glycerol glycerophosphotransferase family protein [Rhizobiaceae bacterium]|nr:CDP-glycerol glycerophosphotransferase family protein [Rhizobiaceae bacterium]
MLQRLDHFRESDGWSAPQGEHAVEAPALPSAVAHAAARPGSDFPLTGQSTRKSRLPRRVKALLGRLLSPFVPVRPGRIVLVTRDKVPIAGNIRIVADALLDAGYDDVVLYKDGPIRDDARRALEAKGAKVLSGFSLSNLLTVLGAQTVFLGHSARDAHISTRKAGRKIINLWHGVPLKRIELLMTETPGRQLEAARLKLMQRNAELYDYGAASTPADRDVIARALGIPAERVFVHGLPRFDYMRPDHPFPADLAGIAASLVDEAAGRRIVTYAPTFRELSASPLRLLTDETIAEIRAVCREFGLVFALRPHPYDLKLLPSVLRRGGDAFMDAGPQRIPEAAIILRHTDVLISDYSSVWVDFLYLNRPVVGLMPDFDQYAFAERGFVHDLKSVFPGPIHHNWAEALGSLRLLASRGARREGDAEEIIVRRKRAGELFLPEGSGNGDRSAVSRLLTSLSFER